MGSDFESPPKRDLRPRGVFAKSKELEISAPTGAELRCTVISLLLFSFPSLGGFGIIVDLYQEVYELDLANEMALCTSRCIAAVWNTLTHRRAASQPLCEARTNGRTSATNVRFFPESCR